MYHVINASQHPDYLSYLGQLRRWLEAEWGPIDPFDGTQHGRRLPAPRLAIEEEHLLGGVAYTWYPKPGSGDIVLWLNALYVAPPHRERGVAAALVASAESAALEAGETELFAYTNIPLFYEKLGWQLIETEADASDAHVVLHKKLPSQ